MKYICKENLLLEKINTNIFVNFEYEFLGRKLNDKFNSNYEKLEKEYFQSSDFSMDAIFFSFEIKTDNNNCIKKLNIHKYQDKYFGHGRPITDELSLSLKDKKAIRVCLNNSIDTSVEDEYKTLVNTIKNRDALKTYKVAEISSKGITLCNKKDIFVSKKDLIKILNLSHSFIDVLYEKNIYKNNKDIIDEELIDPILAILSCYDYSDYPNLKELKKEAEIRKIAEDSEEGYKKLTKAIKAGNDEEVKQYAKYAVIYDKSTNDENIPLILALRYNAKYVKTLLEAGSYANPSYSYTVPGDKTYIFSAIEIAYENKDYKSLKLIAEYYDSSKMEHEKHEFNDYNNYDSAFREYNRSVNACHYKKFDRKALEILIPHMDMQNGLGGSCDYDLKYEDIEFLTNYQDLRIDWEAKEFEKVYPISKELCMKMIKQGCEIAVINTFIELNDFDLFKYCADNWIKQHSYFFNKESYIKLFSKPKKWYEIARKFENRNFDLKGQYLNDLKKSDKKKYDNIIEKYGIKK